MTKLDITKKGKERWISVLIKIVFLFLVTGLVIFGGVSYTKKKKQEQIDLVGTTDENRESLHEKIINPTDREAEEIKDNFRERIANLTSEEKEKIENASSLEEAKEIFSAALTTRITNNLTRCVLDKDGHIYVIMEDDDWISSEDNWISEKEIAPSYGTGLFSEKDYQKIRTAFLTEIKRSPEKWEIVREEHGITGLKEKGKIRMHSWRGFKFTTGEEERISEKIVTNDEETNHEEEELVCVWYLGLSCYTGIPAGHVFVADTYHDNIPVGLLFIENDNPSLPNNLIKNHIYLFASAFRHIFMVEIDDSLALYYRMDNPDFSLREIH